MARSTKSYEERLLQLEKREQESLEKAKQYAAQKLELKKRQKDVETKKRTHRLCQIGGAVESVIGSAIEEEDIPKLVGFLKRQEANGKYILFPFTTVKMVTQLLFVAAIFVHIFINIRPLLVSLGIISYKERRSDIYLILSVLLLFIAGAVILYYIGWQYL